MEDSKQTEFFLSLALAALLGERWLFILLQTVRFSPSIDIVDASFVESIQLFHGWMPPFEDAYKPECVNRMCEGFGEREGAVCVSVYVCVYV